MTIASDGVSVAELPKPVGFVLGGGGSLGAIQVGMLRALAENGATPDLVVGTSVGSLNGTMIALDAGRAADRLARIWSRVERRDVFPGGLVAQVKTLSRTKTHLFPNTGLANFIGCFLADIETFADLTLPFAAVAMDVATTEPLVIREGPLLPALLASAAIPGIFPPVELDGRTLYDGGVISNVPMRQAVHLGARSLVVLDCAFPGHVPKPPRSVADAFLLSMLVTMRSQAMLEAPIVAAEVPVVYLPGPPLRRVSPLDFNHTDELVHGAYEAVHRFLETLRVVGPGLYGSPSRASD